MAKLSFLCRLIPHLEVTTPRRFKGISVLKFADSHKAFSTTCQSFQEVTEPQKVLVPLEAVLRPPLPILTGRTLKDVPIDQKPRQVWVNNLDTLEEDTLGIIDLHPDVFATFPRIDLIHKNVVWQRKYKFVNYANTKVRAEVRGGGRKPWPQKGSGRARHGSIRSPLWKGGGVVHGPRGPRSYFYMLDFPTRLRGLTSILSAKLAQDDLKVVDSLDIPVNEPSYLEQLVEQRHWGMTVLFVDDNDIFPKNITAASDQIKHINLMPVYGLNVYSMLKHETLVLTVAAVDRLEERLLYHLHRPDFNSKCQKFKLSTLRTT